MLRRRGREREPLRGRDREKSRERERGRSREELGVAREREKEGGDGALVTRVALVA